MDSIIWAGIATGCVAALAGIALWGVVRVGLIQTKLKAYKRSMHELERLNAYLISSETLTPCTVCGVVIPTMWTTAINPYRHLTCRV